MGSQEIIFFNTKSSSFVQDVHCGNVPSRSDLKNRTRFEQEDGKEEQRPSTTQHQPTDTFL